MSVSCVSPPRSLQTCTPTSQAVKRLPLEPLRSSKSRRILPKGASPSLVLSPGTRSQGRTINVETTRTKVDERVATYLSDAVFQEIMECRLERGRTYLQGARGDRSHHAAHHSLQPTLQDDTLEEARNKLFQGQVTPRRSKPYLKARLSITSPDIARLQKDPSEVDPFLRAHLPVRGSVSSFAGTEHEKHRNATYENPIESNQLDSLLEAHLNPICEGLATQRFEKTITAEKSTLRLVKATLAFYEDVIPKFQNRLEKIREFHEVEKRLVVFERAFAGVNDIPADQLSTYFTDIHKLCALKTELISNEIKIPRWRTVEERREDYKYLAQIAKKISEKASYKELKDFFMSVRSQIKTPSDIQDISKDLEHYQLLLTEAEVQQGQVALYNSDNAIHELFLMSYGKVDKGVRREPTWEEVRDQVVEMIRPSLDTRLKLNLDIGGTTSNGSSSTGTGP